MKGKENSNSLYGEVFFIKLFFHLATFTFDPNAYIIKQNTYYLVTGNIFDKNTDDSCKSSPIKVFVYT